MAKTEVLNVRLPKDLVQFLDLMVQQGIYKSRSEAIREFTREYVLGGVNNVR